MIINVCILALAGSKDESFFHDTGRAVQRQYQSLGIECLLNINKLLKGAINIILGAGTAKAPDMTMLRDQFKDFKVVIFNLEPILTTSTIISKGYLNFISKYIVFDYAIENVNFLRQSGFNAFLFPLLPEPLRFSPDVLKKDIDVLFVGGMSERREVILNRLGNEINVTRVNGLYGTNLHPILERTFILLNLHYYNNSPCEVARFIPAVNRVSWIVSETTTVPSHFLGLTNNLVLCQPEHIREGLLALLRSPRNSFSIPSTEGLEVIVKTNALEHLRSITTKISEIH
jgi:hypothetical protein